MIGDGKRADVCVGVSRKMRDPFLIDPKNIESRRSEPSFALISRERRKRNNGGRSDGEASAPHKIAKIVHDDTSIFVSDTECGSVSRECDRRRWRKTR